MKISIDLWGTLIKSSPRFNDKKIELSRKYFGGTIEETTQRFSEIKTSLNIIIERTGWMPSEDTIIFLVCKSLDVTSRCSAQEHKMFYNEYQALALTNLPVIYDETTVEALSLLSLEHDLILSSNTLILNGSTMSIILSRLKLDKFFSQVNFSCKLGCSKPITEMYGYSKFHIGDNVITDKLGANNAGSIGIIINTNGKKLIHAYEFIKQNQGCVLLT